MSKRHDDCGYVSFLAGEKQAWSEPDIKRQQIATEDSPLSNTTFKTYHAQYTLKPADLTSSKAQAAVNSASGTVETSATEDDGNSKNVDTSLQ